MSTQRRSLAGRAPRLTETGPAPDAAPLAHRRVAAAGLAAAAISLAADAVLATIGGAAFTVPASFGKFEFTAYAVRTVLTAAGATATWWALIRLSFRPKWLLTRLAALATALFLTPDFLLLGTPGNPTGPVVIVMLMHLALTIITYTVLIKVAPRVRRCELTGETQAHAGASAALAVSTAAPGARRGHGSQMGNHHRPT